MLLTAVDNGDARAFLASTTCSTTTVRVVLDIVRQSEVDNMRQVVNIQSSRCYIRRHQQLRQMVTELLHRQVALLLGEIPMQRLGIIAVTDEFIGNLLCLDLRTTEDNGEDSGVIVYDAFQGEVLILGIHQIIDVVHILRPLVAATHDDLLIVMQVFLGNPLHFTAHRSREHQRIMLLGQ